MHARNGRRATVLLAVAAALAGSSLTASSHAEAGDSLPSLRAADTALASQVRSVALELYALESARTRAGAELTVARRRLAGVRAQAAAAARRLGYARQTSAIAERHLAERLNSLYVSGSTDLVEVLLGSRSLDEALERVNGLEAMAAHDRSIIRLAQAAKRRLSTLSRRLAAREQRLTQAADAAEARAAALERAAAARRDYLAEIAAERRLGAARIATLEQRAAARARATTAQPRAVAAAAEPETLAVAPTAAASTPAPAPAPAASGARTLTVSSTGYALRGTTASGVPVGWGVVAVDPAVIPLGTRMTIPGYGEGVAADTGGAVRGATIDLWFPSVARALAWGRRTVTITLH